MIKRLFFTTTLLLSTLSYAQTSYTLYEAQNYALANSPLAKLAKLDIESAEEKIKEVRAMGLPQINAEGKFTNFLDLPTSVIPAQFFNPSAGPDEFLGVKFGTDFNVTGGISVSQLLFDGSFLVGLEAAKMYPALSTQNAEKVNQDIKASVAQAYYLVAVTNKNLEFIEELQKASDQLKTFLNVMKEKGMMDSSKIDQIDLSLKRLESQKRKAVLDKNLSLKSLKMSMGMDLNATIDISEKIDVIINSIQAFPLNEEYSVESNISYSILETSKTLQELNLKSKKAGYLPSLAAFFSHQQQALRNQFDFFASEPWYPSTLWGIQLNIPLFSSGMRKSQVEQQSIEIKKVEANMEIAKQSITLQFEAAKAEFIGAKEIYDSEAQAYVLAEKIKNRSDRLYKKNMTSMLEVSQAELQLLESKSSLIQAMYGLVNAKVKLDKITNNYE